jgi:PTS system glucitol/sorbitol-specific IIA component
MSTVYHTTFTRIGDCARESLAENMMITFREGAPEDVESFCFIHHHGTTQGEVQAGGTLTLASHNFPITAVGEVVTQNLRDLGHITIRFDGAEQAEFPGSIHVIGPIPTDIVAGSQFTIQA